MNDMGTHILLLFVIGLAIAGKECIGSFYAEPDDAKALRSLPKRLVVFLIGCTVVAGLMLLAEHTLARV